MAQRIIPESVSQAVNSGDTEMMRLALAARLALEIDTTDDARAVATLGRSLDGLIDKLDHKPDAKDAVDELKERRAARLPGAARAGAAKRQT